MSVRTLLGTVGLGSSEALPADDVRKGRVASARRVSAWTELEESALVPRPPRFLVHSETDEVFKRYRSAIFAPGETQVGFNELMPMTFYVDQGGEPQFLERLPGTWSEMVADRAKRKLKPPKKMRLGR